MELFGIGACALCTVIFGALVKKSNKEYAVLMTAAACVLILLAVLNKAEPLVGQIRQVAEQGAFQGEYLSVMLKAVGITLAGQAVSQVCKDAGEGSLAYAVDLAAKAAVLTAAMPVLFKVFEYLEEIAKL